MEALLTFDKASLDGLSDGVLLLDPQGAIVGVNRAGQPSLKFCIEMRERLAKEVAAANEGSLSLPAELALGESPTQGATATLCRNSRRGYALLVRPRRAAAARAAPQETPEASLLGSELLGQMKLVAAELQDFPVADADAAAARARARRLGTVLQQVTDLAELRQRDESFSDERFLLGGLLREMLPRLPRQRGDDRIRYAVEDIAESGAIYGNRRWVEQAMQTLLTRVAEGCPAGGQVRIELRQIGDFVVLTIGAGTDGQKLPFAPTPPARRQSEAHRGLALEICRRIVELHGGRIKLRTLSGAPSTGNAADDPIDTVTLTLPTGLPVADRSRASCTECRITTQAMQYARDLAAMMTVGQANADTTTGKPSP